MIWLSCDSELKLTNERINDFDMESILHLIKISTESETPEASIIPIEKTPNYNEFQLMDHKKLLCLLILLFCHAQRVKSSNSVQMAN